MATTQTTALGRSSKAYVMTESSFGTFTKATGGGAQRIEEMDIERDEKAEARKVYPGTRSVISTVEGRRNVKWSMKMPAIPSGVAGTPPDCHELLLMTFGGTTGYSNSAGVSDTYTLKGEQSSLPTATITQNNDSVSQKIATGAYCDEWKFTYSNGMPMMEFSGGAKDYGSCIPTTVFTDASAAAVSLDVSDPHAILPPAVISIASSSANDNISVTAKQFKCLITIVSYAGLENAVMTVHRNGVEQTVTETTDWNAVTSNTQTATNLKTYLDGLTGITATNPTTETVLVVWDAGSWSGGINQAFAAADRASFVTEADWTIANYATLTCSALSNDCLATNAVTPYVPAQTLNTNDEPLSGLRGTFTWAFVYSPALSTGVILSELELSVKNNANGINNEMLQKTTSDVELGERMVSVKGKFRARKDWLTQFAAGLAQDDSAMKFVFGDVAGFKFTFTMPKVKTQITNMKIPGSDFAVVEFEGLCKATSATAENELSLVCS